MSSHNAPVPTAWSLPFERIDKTLGKWEERLCVAVLTAEILLLVTWVFINVMSGTGYFANWLNWMQNASLLNLFGGTRGLVTRLTLCLALLGASMATSKGKHINVDVALRFLSPNFRLPVAVFGWLVAAVVCFVTSWGFVDQIAIANFRIDRLGPCAEDATKRCEITASDELGKLAHEIRRDAFLVGRQMSLDLRTGPRVLVGKPYDQTLTGAEWNTWLKGADWDKWFAADDVQRQLMADDKLNESKSPSIVMPGGGEEVSGILVRDFNLVIPFGLLVIGLRFILRILLAIGGRITVDPDAAHADDDVEAAHPAQGVAP